MIRIKDIADRAGVSPTTVSNVIHGKTGRVSKATVEKINRILKEMEYVPSISARMLANNSSGLIGVALGFMKKGNASSFRNLLLWRVRQLPHHSRQLLKLQFATI